MSVVEEVVVIRCSDLCCSGGRQVKMGEIVHGDTLVIRARRFGKQHFAQHRLDRTPEARLPSASSM